MASPYPEDLKQKLQKDIESILKEVAKVKDLKNYDVIPNLSANLGDGFISQFYTGKIVNKDNKEVMEVGIKRAPELEFSYQAAFQNEIIIYSLVFPTLDALQKSAEIQNSFDNYPEYFASGMELKKEFLALSNLKTSGYVLYDKAKYFDQKHLELLFKTYGKFHALSFVFKKQNPEKYSEIASSLTDIYERFAILFSKSLIDCFTAAVENLDRESKLYKEIKEFPEYFFANYLNAIKYNGKYRCIIHGDCWSNNMLFKYSDTGNLEDVKLIDFQLSRDGTPIHDLSYFFYSGASKADIDNLQYYLKIYHKSLLNFIDLLGENSKDIFTFDILIKEWKDNALLGMLMGISSWQPKLTAKEDVVKVLIDTKETTEGKFKLLDDLYEKTRKSNAYLERTSAILNHAFEYGIIGKHKVIRKIIEENNNN